MQIISGPTWVEPFLSRMERSDLLSHRNGRQRKATGTAPSLDGMRGAHKREMNIAVPEEEAEALIGDSDSDNHGHRVERGIRGELGSVSLLLFLYVLQGIPLGLAGSVPLILQTKKASYSDQAFFSFVFWPFSLKLLWAPLVDSLYFSRFGRR